MKPFNPQRPVFSFWFRTNKMWNPLSGFALCNIRSILKIRGREQKIRKKFTDFTLAKLQQQSFFSYVQMKFFLFQKCFAFSWFSARGGASFIYCGHDSKMVSFDKRCVRWTLHSINLSFLQMRDCVWGLFCCNGFTKDRGKKRELGG